MELTKIVSQYRTIAIPLLSKSRVLPEFQCAILFTNHPLLPLNYYTLGRTAGTQGELPFNWMKSVKIWTGVFG